MKNSNINRDQDIVRILIVDDRKLVHESLKVYLEAESDLEIVGYSDSGATALEQIREVYPDVAIVDLEMPDMDGIEAIGIISEDFPGTKVLVLSGHEEPEYIYQAITAGAKGYLLKGTTPPDLANGIRYVNKGYCHLGPGLLEKLALSTLDKSMVESKDNLEQRIQKPLQQLRWELTKQCKTLVEQSLDAKHQQLNDFIDLKLYSLKSKQSETVVNFKKLERKVNLLFITQVFLLLIILGNMIFI